MADPVHDTVAALLAVETRVNDASIDFIGKNRGGVGVVVVVV